MNLDASEVALITTIVSGLGAVIGVLYRDARKREEEQRKACERDLDKMTKDRDLYRDLYLGVDEQKRRAVDLTKNLLGATAAGGGTAGA